MEQCEKLCISLNFHQSTKYFPNNVKEMCYDLPVNIEHILIIQQ